MVVTSILSNKYILLTIDFVKAMKWLMKHVVLYHSTEVV